ncbi:metal ABC transporter permease [Anaplasmataceae bacterium AB001_6]|nr:metal ABC transporter permease [Anaplasmataceae bacterium AB001_6]
MFTILLPYIALIFSISVGSGILGPFLVWRRLSFLADTIAHSSILFFAISYRFGINNYLILLLTSIFITTLIIKLEKYFANDLILSITSSTCIAGGLILILITGQNSNILHDILFGDILLVKPTQIIAMSILAAIIALLFVIKHKDWLLITINKDIAQTEGINVTFSEVIYLSLLTTFIILAIKSIGAILITAFLTIPSIASKMMSKNPVTMIINASIFCIITSIIGLLVSFAINLATSPTIILIMVLSTIFSYLIKNIIKYIL